jgi:hypothetical protein
MIVFSKSARQLRDPEPDAPSPERIRELTAEIRQHWTPRERRRRSGTIPAVELLEMPLQPRRKGFWGEL